MLYLDIFYYSSTRFNGKYLQILFEIEKEKKGDSQIS